MSAQAPLTIIEAFKERRSVRIFGGQSLTAEQQEALAQSIKEANSLETPFHSPGVEVSSTEPGLGNPRVIRGEAGFIVCKIPHTNSLQRNQITDVCYRAHHALMRLAQNHVNTIWIAGTYDEDKAERRFKGYQIPSVIAIGNGEASREQNERLKQMMGIQSGRFPFDQIFYDAKSKKRISEKDAASSEYPPYMKDFLAALRSGPSAINLQPWRFMIDGNDVHLFDAKFNNYSPFDMGIALANLHLLAEFRGGNCTFEIRNKVPEAPPSFGTYIATAVYH
ncbi:hypothetical protein M9Y10_010278 [Tritrichomonas musculus]|uniref:Putative nitroreductase TM1586 domain-containing protein n=1 Tax=Tritrichomonas musculus TaxID=1915356 RepID=A0ABR2ILH3_9EUKA